MRAFFTLTFLISLLGCKEPPPPNPNFEVGVVTHVHSGPEMDLLAKTGVKWARISASWMHLEPEQGKWDWSSFENAVSATERAGLKVFATLGNSPPWTSSNGKFNGVPNPKAWRTFVEATVSRYKNRVRVWGVWNEPNLDHFWAGDAKDYVHILLNPAYLIIKGIDPELKVAAPELAFRTSSAKIKPLDFFNTIRKEGAADHFDIITHHAYSKRMDDFIGKVKGYYTRDILHADGIKQVLEKSGFFDREFWLTEFGWNVRSVGENDQAESLAEALSLLAREPWIKNAFIYELRDDPNYDPQWGLLLPDNTPRRSYYSIKNAIESGFKNP